MTLTTRPENPLFKEFIFAVCKKQTKQNVFTKNGERLPGLSAFKCLPYVAQTNASFVLNHRRNALLTKILNRF